MKKFLSLGFASVLLSGLAVGGLPAFAVEEQVVQGRPEGRIQVDGHVGMDATTTDPTDPNAPGAGEIGWVKVSLPATAEFHTTATSKHRTIESIQHRVANQSNYPVKIDVTGFVGLEDKQVQLDDVDSLRIVTTLGGQTDEYKLVADGKAISGSLLSISKKLGSGGAIPAEGTFKAPAAMTFAFKGNTDTTKTGHDLMKTGSTVKNDLVLGFTALDGKGEIVTKKT